MGADEDKLAAFQALAGDLGKSMKDKVIKQGEEAEQKRNEAKELQERLNREREKMLMILENDIDALGWDQMPKCYAVSLAEDGTEMLNLIEDLPGHPVTTLMKIASTGELRNEAVALVVTNESWQYPDYLSEHLLAAKDKRATRALWKLLPPTVHPLRVEGRQVTLVDRTGQYLSVHRIRGEAEAHINVDVDRSLVRAMKCLLGIDRRWNHLREAIGKSFTIMNELMEVFRKGHDEIWTEATFVETITEVLAKVHPEGEKPEEIAAKIMQDMPQELRRHFGFE